MHVDTDPRPWVVEVLNWPEQAERSEALSRTGKLRVLLVAPGVEPPIDWDNTSDWIRRPVDDRDVLARIEALQRRAERSPVPAFDADGLLWRGRLWVALAPIEARLMTAFLERPGAVVGRRDLLAAGWPRRAPKHRALDGRLQGLRARIAPLGLGIANVRQRGFLLMLSWS